MLRVSLKGLWAHKRRLFGTVFAVLLGVAFLAGTLVLGDTMRAGFDDRVHGGQRGTDASCAAPPRSAAIRHQTRGLIDASLADEIAKVDGVAAVAPRSSGSRQIVGKDGDPIGGNGPPTMAGSWITDPAINPWNLVEGRAPEGRRARS